MNGSGVVDRPQYVAWPIRLVICALFQSREETHFDHRPFRASIAAPECIQRVIERDEIEALLSAHPHGVVERDVRHAAALQVLPSRMTDEEAAHQLR